ncbi:restriction endonuclease subunit S [Streptomyces hydrogenans]|uniref:Restriction endonuclease subunit S n=1 Tax=Streptomyces hydrogenans TaxID=1873719 RepID=A0ABQ3PE45_9ACTN|nr:restriction endonuclease subunit S [Streptomyces hydrogenans]GHG14761.1 hypothetical protein GCM10018784_29880 [Streptomyces hydrogenans]GHI23276.1 hypothetical protein Shyd_46470 [Streptomyces hydrogenans]
MSDWQQTTLDDPQAHAHRTVPIPLQGPNASMSDWQQVTMGRLFSPDNTRLGPHTDEPIVMSLSKYDGFVRADDYFDKRIASEKLDGYKIVEPGEWAYSTIHIDEGSIARNNLGETGVISPMYTTLRWRGERVALPEYAELLVRSPRMLAEYTNNAQGSVNRRRSLPFKAFSAIGITLPPLPVQERIVEVIGTVDEKVVALKVEADSLLRVRNAALGEMLSQGGDDWLSAPLSEAGTLIRGRRFVKSDYVESGLGCIHYGQIYTDYGASATRTVTHLPESLRSSMRLAQHGDVVIAGTSENVDDVGKAVAWLGDEGVAVHDDCFIFRHDLDPKFVSYFFASPLFQHRKRQFTSETKVVRISATNLKKIVMPVPPRTEQQRISGVATAMDAQINALCDEAERLRQARAALVSGLLEHTIDIKSVELEV